MTIDIYMDHVIIEGQTIRRPSYISRLQWLNWWESTVAFKKAICKQCGRTANELAGLPD